MTNLLSRAFPPPSNWQDFERLCFDVFSRIWKTNDAQLHGRTGQPQFGVDVYGTDRVEQTFVGVQCKGKDQGYENPLTKSELQEEVEKAKNFRPKLGVFVVATSAPNDEAVQAVARELTQKHKLENLFEVRVEGWTTLRQRVSDYPEIVQKYFSELAPLDVVEKIDSSIAVVREEGQETRTLIEKTYTATVATWEKADAADRLQTRITDLAKLVEDGQVIAGLRALERLWDDESSNASPRNRYRIRANIGFAHLQLDETQRAIAELRAAADEDPSWPGAKAVRATAEFLAGDRDRAYSLAREALSEDPTAHQAATLIAQTAPDSATIAELLGQLPAVHMEKIDLILTFVERARRIGDVQAQKDLTVRAVSLAPNDWRVLAMQADPLIEPIFNREGMAITHAVPAELVPDLEKAITLLQQSWELLTKRDNGRVGAYVVANLLTALDVAGRSGEYEQLLPKALEVAPNSKPLLRRYAQAMIAVDDWAAAHRALSAIPAEEEEIADRLFKVQAEIRTDGPSNALDRARALEIEIGAGKQAEIAAALQIEASQRAGTLDQVLPDILARWPRSILLRSIAHNNMGEADPRRAELLAEIKSLIDSINNPADRMHAAEALYSGKQFAAAADLYSGLFATDKDTVALFRSLRALFFADRRREARELFESLAPNLRSIPRYADLGVAIYEHAGMLREARAILDNALASDDTLQRRIHWLSLSERLGDKASIAAWLATVSLDQSGAPRDLMTLALAIDRHQSDPRSFPIAYRALRAGYTDPDLHVSYMVGLVIMGQAQKRAFSKPKVVEKDTAVVLEEKDGPRKLTRILETEPDPKLERDEIAPNKDIWDLLVGRKVGDEIEIPSIGLGPTIYIVREIRDKYLHAHLRSLEHFDTMFPGHHAFGSFHIDEKKGDEKFKPIFDSVKRRGEFATKLLGMYRQGPLPIMLMSRWGGVSPCDTWEFIAAQPDLGVKVCFGHPQEFAAADASIIKSQNVVVDGITIYALTRLGIADKARACFSDMGVVQTTIDMLRTLLLERTRDRGRQHGSLGWDGEHFRMVEVDVSYDDAKIAQAQAALDFAESLTLVPAEPVAGLPEDKLELFEDVDPSFLDTVYAAQGSRRLIYSDDRDFRHLAAELSGTEGIWTQPAARKAVQIGKISPADYYEIAGALACADYRFTQIDNHLILRQLDAVQWSITGPIQILATQLALPTNDLGSVIRLLADVAQFGWERKPNETKFGDFFSALFRAFRRVQPASNPDTICAAVIEVLRARFRSNGYRILLKNRLLNTTVFRSSQPMIDDINNAAEGTLATVATVLRGAVLSANQTRSS